MSDQPTHAREPEADPRQAFTLSKEDAMALDDLAQQTLDPALQDRLNTWWMEAGKRLGFVWTTVADIVLGDAENTREGGLLTSAAFTAWPEQEPVLLPDPDAIAWLADMVTDGDPEQLKNRELILLAWSAGRDTGFAMGSATAPANRPGLGWDGMELIRQSAELLRFYESSHLAKVERLVSSGARDPDTEAAVDDANSKARRNATQAKRLESFLANPTQSHLVHDGLREARQDNATAALAGWNAAMLQVRELAESGRAQAGSGIPPLLLLSRLDELPPPDDMDEVFQRLRDPMAQVERLRVALREWFDKSDWVGQAVRAGVPKKLGMPNQLGRHTMDTARDMVERLNDLLAQVILDGVGKLKFSELEGLADLGSMVPPAIALSSTGVDLAGRHTVQEPVATVAGLFPGDPGYKGATSARFPIAEGLDCEEKPEGEA